MSGLPSSFRVMGIRADTILANAWHIHPFHMVAKFRSSPFRPSNYALNVACLTNTAVSYSVTNADAYYVSKDFHFSCAHGWFCFCWLCSGFSSICDAGFIYPDFGVNEHVTSGYHCSFWGSTTCFLLGVSVVCGIELYGLFISLVVEA